jgi:hypothetical protein
MALAEKLTKKLEKRTAEFAEKSKAAGIPKGAHLESGDWLLLFLASIYVDILFVILTVIGLIPIIGQVIYAICDPGLNFLVAGIFWMYLYNKGLGGYWYLAFGGGLANFIPVVNWFGWTLAVIILYTLVTAAEKVPWVGKVIEIASKATPKVK